MTLYIAKEMNKLDFGSGYNPGDGFKTCDIYGYVDYYFDPETYTIQTTELFHHIRCRNVIHHIKDLDRLADEFYDKLYKGGTLEIIDVREEYFEQNYYLDYLWYRYVIPRYEVWFSKKYRDPEEYFLKFDLKGRWIEGEKEHFIFTK